MKISLIFGNLHPSPLEFPRLISVGQVIPSLSLARVQVIPPLALCIRTIHLLAADGAAWRYPWRCALPIFNASLIVTSTRSSGGTYVSTKTRFTNLEKPALWAETDNGRFVQLGKRSFPDLYDSRHRCQYRRALTASPQNRI